MKLPSVTFRGITQSEFYARRIISYLRLSFSVSTWEKSACVRSTASFVDIVNNTIFGVQFAWIYSLLTGMPMLVDVLHATELITTSRRMFLNNNNNGNPSKALESLR